jgi:hypothetical protein
LALPFPVELSDPSNDARMTVSPPRPRSRATIVAAADPLVIANLLALRRTVLAAAGREDEPPAPPKRPPVRPSR